MFFETVLGAALLLILCLAWLLLGRLTTRLIFQTSNWDPRASRLYLVSVYAWPLALSALGLIFLIVSLAMLWTRIQLLTYKEGDQSPTKPI